MTTPGHGWGRSRLDGIRTVWRASEGATWGQFWRFARALWRRR